MTLTCANCGYINDAANETTANCPNCGVPYGSTTAYDTMAPTTPPPTPAMAFAPLSGAALTPQRSRKGLFIGLGVALLVVVLLAGGVAFAASQNHSPVAAIATVTPSPTAIGKGEKVTYQTYSDPQGQFSLKYPSTWTTSTSATTIQHSNVNLTSLLDKNAKGTAIGGVLVAVGGTNLTLQNVGDILATDHLTGYSTTGAPTTMTTKNGTTWQDVMGTATTAKGKAAKVEAALAQHGANAYLVVGLGDGKIFMYMLKSMTLGASA